MHHFCKSLVVFDAGGSRGVFAGVAEGFVLSDKRSDLILDAGEDPI